MRRRPIIPKAAVERIVRRHGNGSKADADYYLRRKKVGRRCWDHEGRLEMEYGLNNGLMHGPFRVFHENGAVLHETRYVAGREHGLSRQYDEHGVPIGTYKMNHGTGVDLWFIALGELSEERHFKNGHIHGFERWWNNRRTVWEERHFKDSLDHGIQRQWNRKGVLKRGFPKYFILGKAVSKRDYIKACKTDPSPPVFREQDNKPYRKLPEFSKPGR